MFVAWLITISVFLICIYSTYVIIEGIKEKDQNELAILKSQYKKISIDEKSINKQIA
jgi:uncharacterized membrane protein